MKKNWPKIICFIVVLFLYFLPSIVIKVDHEFYESLKGPHLPAAIFIIAWSVIYICMSLLITYYIYNNKPKESAEVKRVYIFTIINYLLSIIYLFTFFKLHNLFLGYVSALFIFVSIVIVFLESLLVNKKTSLLTIPYILWSGFASVLSIIIYLQN